MKKMKKRHILEVLGVAVAVSALVWAVAMAGAGRPGPQDASADATRKSPKTAINEAMSQALADSASSPLSNPYAIALGCPSLDQVVALGTPGLIEAISQIEDSSESGLREYLLAICVKRIAKADVTGPPGTDSYWNTGKEFPRVWRAHLGRIPSEVAQIAKSSEGSEEKNARLTALGIPAIPFILDEVEGGRTDLAPAAEALMEGTAEMGCQSPKGLWTAARAKELKGRFSTLRSLVLNEMR